MQSDTSNSNTPASNSAGQTESQPAQPTFTPDPADSFEPVTDEDIVAVLFGLRRSATYDEIFGGAPPAPAPAVLRSVEEVMRELEYAEFSVALQAAYDATFGRPVQAAAANNASSETQTAAAQDEDQPMDETDETVSTGQ